MLVCGRMSGGNLLVVFALVALVRSQGRHNFDDAPDDRCITPNRRAGRCVPLNQCPTLFVPLQTRVISPRDRHIRKYLDDVLCTYKTDMPDVCCELDAGQCVTVENKPGSCIPLRRCDVILSYLESKPLLNQEKIEYLKHSECEYGENPMSRVCCPIFRHDRLTGQIVTRSQNITNFTPNTITTSSPPLTATRSSITLPTPGEEEGHCGIGEIADKIVGGNITDIYEYPWMALLKTGDGEMPCGGSLIHPRYVLTAAHCVVGQKVILHKNVTGVRLGEYNITSERDCVKRTFGEECSNPPVDIVVEEIIAHPGFSETTLKHDIALIRLAKPAPHTEFIRPICLPTSPIEFPSVFRVAGWGRTDTEIQSTVKMHLTNLPFFDKANCAALYSRSNLVLGSGQFCAGGLEGQDTCTGDSGGPIMTTIKLSGQNHVYFQMGIVSFGPKLCALPDRPGVYTRVEEYMDWVLSNMRD